MNGGGVYPTVLVAEEEFDFAAFGGKSVELALQHGLKAVDSCVAIDTV